MMKPMKKLCGALLACLMVLGFSLSATATATATAKAATMTVTSLADDGSAGTLRSQIAAAAAGDSINFAVTGTITLASALPSINTDVTISNTQAGNVTISGDAAWPIFTITSGTVGIANLTISNGLGARGSDGYAYYDDVYWGEWVGSTGGNGGGGAVTLQGGTLNLSNCTLSGNTGGAGGNGGNADYVGGNGGSGGGGAVSKWNGTLNLSNCTLSGNTGGAGGDRGYAYALHGYVGLGGSGGIFQTSGTLTMQNSTLVGNSGGYGGGYSGGIFNAGTLILNNSIVAGNSGSIYGPDIYSTGTFNGDYNLVQDTAGANLTGTHNVTGQAPLLGALDIANGGSTATMALQTGSPAVNAGDPAFDGTGLFDQRGTGFDRVKRGRLDIGAFESDFIGNVNIAPVAEDQTVTTDEETVVAITLGATDADAGDTLTYHISQLPAHGTLTNADNSAIVNNTPSSKFVKYTPELNYPVGGPGVTGPDSFKFKANDGTVDSNEATVSITVNAVCDFPLAVGDSYMVNAGSTLTVAAPGVLGNDSEADGETLHAIKVTGPAHGTLTLRDDGSFVYTPVAGYSGPDSFTYKASDGGLESSAVTVNITVNLVPKVSSFLPPAGAPGTLVTISGSGFSGVTDVQFNGQSVGTGNFTVLSSTKVTAMVQAGALSGKIGVVTASATALSATDFVAAPRISGFTPGSGSAGSSLTVNGFNMLKTTDAKIGTVAAVISARTLTSVTLAVPATAVSGLISITNAGGTATSATPFAMLSTITRFTPIGGGEGTVVTISGSGFGGATDVQFNGLSVGAGNFTPVSSTQITAMVPAGALSGKIGVVTPAATALSATDFVVALRISGFTPSSSMAGSSVTVSGFNMLKATDAKIGGVAAVISARTLTSVTLTVPATAVSGPIELSNAGGVSTSATPFTMLPTIIRFTPTGGGEGRVVTISGSGFGGATDVQFNGLSVGAGNFTPVSSTQITAMVPAGALSGKIGVVTPAATALSATDFMVAPTVTTIVPTSGKKMSKVTLAGRNLASATVKIGTVTQSIAVADRTATSLTFTVANGTMSGSISVTNAGGTINAGAFTVLP